MEGCAIRPWRLQDAADLVGLINNRRVQDNLRDGIPYPYGLQDAKDYLTGVLARDPHQVYAFAITWQGQLAGSISATRGGNIHCRTAELGYYLGEAFWGRGIATAAVELLCQHLFAQTDLLRIFAEPFGENLASCQVLEKAGFQLEGILRCNAVKNGVVRDMKLYARLRPNGDLAGETDRIATEGRSRG